LNFCPEIEQKGAKAAKGADIGGMFHGQAARAKLNRRFDTAFDQFDGLMAFSQFDGLMTFGRLRFSVAADFGGACCCISFVFNCEEVSRILRNTLALHGLHGLQHT